MAKMEKDDEGQYVPSVEDVKLSMQQFAVLDAWLRQHCAQYRGVIVLDDKLDQWDLVAWTERTLKKIGE